MVLTQPVATENVVEPLADLCGFNCNWGFGVGVVILIIGPLPGPT